MKKNFLVFFCLICVQVLFSQIRTIRGGFGGTTGGFNQSTDSLPNNEINVKLSGKTKYTDYKIISFKNDTTIVDTTLTIKKHYKFNFLRKDNFELLEFHNQGQTFTNLAYNFDNISRFPDIGFRAKQFNYFNIEDVDYYHVPTPTTEIMYRTGLEQGQVLDALFTINFSKRFNVGIAYKGLRSLGAYRRSLASSGNFRLSFRYESPKDQYAIRGQLVNQDFLNQESGGLTATALASFLSDDPNFSNRGRLDVNLDNAENNFEGRRLYFEHTFKVLSSKDSAKTKDFSNLKVGHSFTRESKFYRFNQSAATTTFFGNAGTFGAVNNKTNFLLYNNQVFLDFNSKYVLGKFRVKADYTTYSYGYENLQNNLVGMTKNKLKGDAVSFGADWNGKIKNFYVNASANLTPGSGRLSGNNLKAEALYKKDSLFTVKAKLGISNKLPNFNFLLHQSNYDAYNWENNFASIGTQTLGGVIESKWGNASLDITNIDNYTYFDENNLPKQFSGNVNYLKAKASKEFKFGKFALDNTFMYQKVASGSDVFRVPEFVTRNTLYYTDHWFKGNPLLVQIGATFNYFSKYKANAYNPLLAEFTLQNTTEIGYPTVDLFFNGRVRRTRIYFKADNISSFFLKKDYLSAPNYPYRDFVIRFGVVWNWFI
ncbi:MULTISPECIES: putative porin [unclassified Tenacibaculum]|uniref:putative porin n=1 Tax=unclassified Tenacibaculum TaxID=2635139 RepID=UPI001F290843|nr:MULTISPECIES: putative porin [unclassified Tenacibaculum]MCF2875468.1 putative porin [Tenacibaculum sp. Cn5-1]MCF2935544.1 putative porin [Tenacibaculum sp. Cn5-34]MCG7512104.1 putative porin [Tenacibaculum sp. Cn5-46]